MTITFADDNSFLNVKMNLNELERDMTVNIGKVAWCFEAKISTPLTSINKIFYAFI
jgi:hypothetical protein